MKQPAPEGAQVLEARTFKLSAEAREQVVVLLKEARAADLRRAANPNKPRRGQQTLRPNANISARSAAFAEMEKYVTYYAAARSALAQNGLKRELAGAQVEVQRLIKRLGGWNIHTVWVLREAGLDAQSLQRHLKEADGVLDGLLSSDAGKTMRAPALTDLVGQLRGVFWRHWPQAPQYAAIDGPGESGVEVEHASGSNENADEGPTEDDGSGEGGGKYRVEYSGISNSAWALEFKVIAAILWHAKVVGGGSSAAFNDKVRRLLRNRLCAPAGAGLAAVAAREFRARVT